jgi:uncharacterized membrane protein
VKSKRWSAVGLAVTAILCTALNARSSVWAVQIATALPLVLYLPGAAIVLSVDPWRKHAAGSERVLWSWLGSIVAAIAGGLVLNLVSELTRTTWLAYLLGVVVVATIASMVRRGGYSEPALRLGDRVPRIRVHTSAALLSVGAGLLIAGALAVSVYSSSNSNREHFVQLWVLPIPAGAGATAARAEVGVTNYEGRPLRFEVSITEPGRVLLSRKLLVLNQGQSWTYHLVRHGSVPVLASVSLASQPSHVLDSVRLASPVRSHK